MSTDAQEPSDAHSPAPWASRIFYLLLVAQLLPIWLVEVFPSQDGPAHAYHAAVLGELLSGGGPMAGLHELRAWVTPYCSVHYLLAGLGGLMDPITADKVMVTVLALGFCLAMRYLARSINPDNHWAPLLAFPFALNKYVYLGYYNFTLGLVLLVLLAGVWQRGFGRWTRRRTVALHLAALLLLVTHPVTYLIFLIFIYLYLAGALFRAAISATGQDLVARCGVALRTNLPSLKRAVLPLLVAPWVLLFVESGAGGSASREDVVTRAMGLVGLWEVTPFNTRPFRAAMALTLAVAVISLVLYLFHRMREGMAPGSERRAGRRTQLLLLLALGCLFTFLVAPSEINDSYDFNVRFAIGAVLFLILAASGTTPRRGRGRWQLVTLATLSLFLVGLQVRHGRQLALELAPVLRTPPVQGARVGVLAEVGALADPMLGFNPYHWAGAHYLRRSGVMMLNSPWMDNPIMLLRVKRPLPQGSFDPREVVTFFETPGVKEASTPHTDILLETRHPPEFKPNSRLDSFAKVRGFITLPMGAAPSGRFGLLVRSALVKRP